MSRPLVIVTGSTAAHYENGGMAWVWLSWALGLRRLGVDVFLIDQLDRARCVFREVDLERTYATCLNVPYFERVMDAFGLRDYAAVIGDDGQAVAGPGLVDVRDVAAEATLLLNIAGNLRVDTLKSLPRIRVFLDIDPAFTQLWLASGATSDRIEGHDLYYTIGENVGTTRAGLPTGGVDWRHTRPPVVLDEWPVPDNGARGAFTTVARWSGTGPYGLLTTIGADYPTKGDQLVRFAAMPELVTQTFEIALDHAGSPPGEHHLLEAHGWRIVDGRESCATPHRFREYVQRSGAEFSPAKGAYVETRSGWFSDRTTRYLASGRPALVQDTGIGDTLPVGEGLLTFRSLEDAVSGAERIAADYERHSEAARNLAEEVFASDVVVARFLEEVGIT